MLCYIINTTSAPVCLIIPISAWVVFFSGVFEQQKEAAVVGSSAMDIYYHIMPYFFYPFLCVIFVLLVILGVIPKMGAISDDSNSEEKEIKPHLWAFVVPMAVVIIVALWLDDILYGVACGIVAWFPAIAFILIGLVCFATGNIWSVHAVCTPIILPMAAACGASIPLTLGSIISAACFGAQACFYSDVTLLSASAYRINNVDYAVAQLPDIGIVTAITFVGYIAAGFMMS